MRRPVVVGKLPPDPSWDELAAAAGVEAPRLAPGDHPMDLELDAQMYWPVVPAALQGSRTGEETSR